MSELIPLPPEVLTAARLRQMAKSLILEAESLEAVAGISGCQPKRRVEYEFAKARQAETRPRRRRPKT